MSNFVYPANRDAIRNGLTTLELFSAHALQGILSNPVTNRETLEDLVNFAMNAAELMHQKLGGKYGQESFQLGKT